MPAARFLPCRAAARAAARSGAPAGDVSATRWEQLAEVVRNTVGGMVAGGGYAGAWDSRRLRGAVVGTRVRYDMAP